jgi:hypothetical protein
MRLSIALLALAVTLPSLAAPVPVFEVGQSQPSLPNLAN